MLGIIFKEWSLCQIRMIASRHSVESRHPRSGWRSNPEKVGGRFSNEAK